MSRTIFERDWKYLRSIQKILIANLCLRINQEATAILQAQQGSEHDRYLKLYKHITKADDIVAECFNDWRRSNIWLKISHLHRHELLKEEHLQNLTHETQDLLT